MKNITHRASLPFTAEQMYNLVNDIESYPKFLPWCKAAKIQDQTASEIQASLTVAKGSFVKTFTTRNYLEPNRSMKLTLVNGPFKHFEGLWTFVSTDNDHCEVTYSMHFEFKSRVVAVVAEPIFAKIADEMIKLFKQRAEEMYS